MQATIWPAADVCCCLCWPNRWPHPASCRQIGVYALPFACHTVRLTLPRAANGACMPLRLLAIPSASPCLVSPIERLRHCRCWPYRQPHTSSYRQSWVYANAAAGQTASLTLPRIANRACVPIPLLARGAASPNTKVRTLTSLLQPTDEPNLHSPPNDPAISGRRRSWWRSNSQ